MDEPRLKRSKRPPAKLDDGAAPYVPNAPVDVYRRIYCEAIDRLGTALDTRYSCDDDILAIAEEALLKAKPQDIKKACDFYGLDEEKMTMNVSMMHTCARDNATQLQSLEDVVEAMKDPRLELQSVVPACAALLKLVLTAPATTCTAERSFSLLRRLKSWLRSTLGQERLNHASICATYPEAVMGLNRAELLSSFIKKSDAVERHAIFRAPDFGASDSDK